MYFDLRVLGLVCLIGGLLLTFVYPLGQRRGSHLVSEIILVILFVIAAYNLIPIAWIPEDETWKVILIGVIVGLIAVIYRDVRRFLRFFRGKVYRMSHPYYWYGRMFRRRRRYY